MKFYARSKVSKLDLKHSSTRHEQLVKAPKSSLEIRCKPVPLEAREAKETRKEKVKVIVVKVAKEEKATDLRDRNRYALSFVTKELVPEGAIATSVMILG